MRLRILMERSIFISLLKKVWKGYSFIELWIDGACKNSQIYKLIARFLNRIKIYCKYSFLGRLKEIKPIDAQRLSRSSFFLRYIINFYRKAIKNTKSYLIDSLVIKFLKASESELRSLSVRKVSIIITAVIATNIVLLFIFKINRSLCSMFINGIFFVMIVTVVYCKNNSIVLRK